MAKKKKPRRNKSSAASERAPDPQGKTLEEWLAQMRRDDPSVIIMRRRFPEEKWKDEYIRTIESRPEPEVLHLVGASSNALLRGCIFTWATTPS
jgi:hypothetical protein